MKIERLGRDEIEVKRNKKRGVKLIVKYEFETCKLCSLYENLNSLCTSNETFCNFVRTKGGIGGDFIFRKP